MELFFLAILIILMATALGSGFPVAFALPGSAIITICLAAAAGYMFDGNVDAYFAQGGPKQWLSAGVTNLRGVYWEVERDTLIAIPLFIFMGIMLQRSKIAEDLLVTMAQLFGPVPGGLGISVVFVGALLAATTGIVGATVVAMGLISLPVMLRNNYSRPLATGTIAASGTLGQIIPPSIVLIILADQLASAVDQASTSRKALHKASTGELSMPSQFDVSSTSAGEMFLGAFVPGLVLVGLYMAFILVFAILRPKSAPAVHFDGEYDRGFIVKVVLTLLPPLALIFMVLGSIISGIATVNQAGAIGAAGALVMAGYRLHHGGRHTYTPAIIAIISLVAILVNISFFETNVKNIKTSSDMLGLVLSVLAVSGLLIALAWSGWRAFKTEGTLEAVMVETAKTTSLVFIILLGAAMLTAAFRAFGGEELVREFLNSLPGGFWSKFFIVMLVIFILGFFLDFIEIAVVVVPIVAPILLADPSANVTAVWLGVMIGLNIQTSFLTPPFGFALFYMRGVAPAIVKTIEIYKGVIAFICLQLAALFIVAMYPNLVNYLPNRISLTAETAPPPRNPRLQYCVEQYVAEQFALNSDTIRGAIASARGIDVSFLPKKTASSLSKSFDQAESTIDLLNTALAAEELIKAAEPAYREIHTEVRTIERKIREIDGELKEIKVALNRLRNETGTPRKQELEAQAAELNGHKDELKASIPAEWADANKAFKALLLDERKARLKYRRATENGYEPVQKLLAVLNASDAFKAMEPELVALREDIVRNEPADMIEPTKKLAAKFSAIEGAGPVKSQLSKARRSLKKKTPEKEKALASMDKAIQLYAEQMTWRAKAEGGFLTSLNTYEGAIRGSIGIRLQRKLSRDQALWVAACNSSHRDISLNF